MTFNRKPPTAYLKFSNLWVKGKGISKNFKWLALEMLFSRQIVEILTSTASVTNEAQLDRLNSASRSMKGPVIGLVGELQEFVPANLFGALLERHLVDMLANKYVYQYGFMSASGGQDSVYIEASDFRLEKRLIPQLTVYLGQLDAVFLGIELLSIVLIWWLEGDVQHALAAVGVLEFLKRFKP